MGLNLKAFLFQLITFIIVLLILRRWVYPKLVATLEARRKALEESLTQAKLTEETLAKAEIEADRLLHKAREQADQSLADAREQAKQIVAKAEVDAEAQAGRIVAEAEAHLAHERNKLSEGLMAELADLVALASEKVLRTKLNARDDKRLIEQSIKELR